MLFDTFNCIFSAKESSMANITMKMTCNCCMVGIIKYDNSLEKMVDLLGNFVECLML